jgi:mercuric ion transport protein
MKTIKSRFIALFSSGGALLGSCGGACGVACAASGCCGSYALFGFIGLSSSSMKFFEKLTPFFLVLTIFSLAYAFYKAYQVKAANCCDTDNSTSESKCCDTSQKTSFFQSKSFLWAITILSFIMWTYPYFTNSNESNSSCGSQTEVVENASLDDANTSKKCCSLHTDSTTVNIEDDDVEN